MTTDPPVPMMKTLVSRSTTLAAAYRQIIVAEGLSPDAAFSIVVPRDWTVQTGAEAERVVPGLSALARFSGADPQSHDFARKAHIIIWRADLPREMHASDWLIAWAASQSFRIENQRQAETSFGLMIDAVAKRHAADGDWIHRLATVKDGASLFLIDARAPQVDFMDNSSLQEAFLLAIQQFSLLSPTQAAFAEPFDLINLHDGSPVQFAAPLSWRRSEGGDAPLGGRAILFENRVDDATVGSMVVVLGGEQDSVENLEKTTIDKLRYQGFAIELQSYPYQARPDRPNMRERAGTRAGRALSILAATAGDARWPLSFVMVTPARQSAFEAWAINRRAFEIAVDTFRAS